MDKPAYRIESAHRIVATLPRSPLYNGELLADRDLAVSLAAKCKTEPPGGVVKVIHVPTGEVVFSKTSEWGAL
ncbi:MAG: hypothetical protein ACK4F4_13865 [Hylemonella sp.]|jgi:hypothetical protein|uniref:hypothetical protein n=1 Tax=Hylemonella sp. TaxID=2066020 RepID=UPI00391BC5A7